MKIKDKIIILAILLCCGMAAAAQQPTGDKELNALIDVVKMLRVSSEANFKKATQILTNDQKWTRMDETGGVREGVEAKASDKVAGFKLNRILSKVEGGRKHVSTHGDMVNGEDTRYDYSLYERTLKAGAEAKYNLKGREGRQTFVIVPFDKSAKFEAYIQCNGNTFKGKRDADGTVVVTWDKKLPSKNQEFTLSVKNSSGAPQSFVIINHNTRKG